MKILKEFLVLALAVVLLSSCASGIGAGIRPLSYQHQTHPLNNDQLYMVGATLWYQRAAEVKALSYQAFNLAQIQLDLDLQFAQATKKPRAIIVDIDETILDNSPYQARVILNGKGFDDQSWEEWVEEAQASPLPGSVEFMNYAHDRGVELFYITNRFESGRQATLKNLRQWGFPIKDDNLLMRIDESSKTQRRDIVMSEYRVVLLIGDQLEDFSHRYDDLSLDEREEVTELYRDEFGHRFIVLPNPMYGLWERLLESEVQNLFEEEIHNLDIWSHSLIPDAI